MRRAFYAIFLTTLVAATSQAGYVGQINLSSGSGSDGSLTNMTTGPLVGTNLLAPTLTPTGGVSSSLGGYFDFTTGAQTSNDGNGNITYAAGGNFFVLTGTLPAAAGTPPIASSLTAGIATQMATGTYDNVGGTEYQIYSLTMSFSGAYINQTAATAFNSPYAPLPTRNYVGSLTFTFVVDSALAGDQILGGTISFTSVPEPSSLAMVVIGGLGVLGYGRRRLRRAA